MAERRTRKTQKCKQEKTKNSSKIKTLWQEGVGRAEGRREMEEDSLLNSNWALLVIINADNDEYKRAKNTLVQGEEAQALQILEELRRQVKPS